MRVLSVVHHRNAAAGVYAEPARAAGHELVEWIPQEGPAPDLGDFGAALVFGAEAQVDQEGSRPWLGPEKQFARELIASGIPALGVCFGSQLLADAAGGVVRPAAEPEIGWHEIELTPAAARDPVLGALPERFEGFQYHHYEWLLPPGAAALARSAGSLQAFRLDGRPVWGLQFHSEVTLADLGSWLDTWHEDPGAVATGLDPEAIRAQSAERIGAWNDVGRAISKRFLDFAAGASRKSSRDQSMGVR